MSGDEGEILRAIRLHVSGLKSLISNLTHNGLSELASLVLYIPALSWSPVSFLRNATYTILGVVGCITRSVAATLLLLSVLAGSPFCICVQSLPPFVLR